jgi:hypothetical protein
VTTNNIRDVFKGVLKGDKTAEKIMKGFLEDFNSGNVNQEEQGEIEQVEIDLENVMLGELFSRFPSGLLISVSSKVYEITYVAPGVEELQEFYEEPPSGGGYVVVRPAETSEFNNLDNTTKLSDVSELLENYDHGIAISVSGMVYEIVYQTQVLDELISRYQTPPELGGFLIARIPMYKNQDFKFVKKEIVDDSTE